MTKLVRSRWLDIGLVLFFFAFLWTSTSSRYIKTQKKKKNLANIQPSEPHAWSITHIYCLSQDNNNYNTWKKENLHFSSIISALSFFASKFKWMSSPISIKGAQFLTAQNFSDSRRYFIAW